MTQKQIVKALTDDIAAGRFAETAKLPSEAKLGERFGVSRMTVRGALAELRRQGLVETRNGTGSFLSRRALRRSGVIGLIIPDFAKFPFFQTLRNELVRLARRLNYRIELVTTDETVPNRIVADIRHKVRSLAALRAEGAVFRPYVASKMAKASREIVQILRHAEIPVVLVDADTAAPPARSECDLVAVDNVAAGRRIAEHLLGRGYRRIAFLAGKGRLAANANWSDRLFGLAGELALRDSENPVRTLHFAPDDRRKVAAAFRGRTAPDAVVCGNDDHAAALEATLLKLGRRVPQDVAVLGFDDGETARRAAPPLTTVSQPAGKIAATAFKTLLARIRYPNNDPREIRLAAPLVIRASTASPHLPDAHSSSRP